VQQQWIGSELSPGLMKPASKVKQQEQIVLSTFPSYFSMPGWFDTIQNCQKESLSNEEN
jgi:hypothetical protein